ncbi:MAG: hypothetical protein P1U88_19680 [Thalassobaculaceae bacterium]|nr:hypothetical protein [Thalassobaculaceae bacterium]
MRCLALFLLGAFVLGEATRADAGPSQALQLAAFRDNVPLNPYSFPQSAFPDSSSAPVLHLPSDRAPQPASSPPTPNAVPTIDPVAPAPVAINPLCRGLTPEQIKRIPLCQDTGQ